MPPDKFTPSDDPEAPAVPSLPCCPENSTDTPRSGPDPASPTGDMGYVPPPLNAGALVESQAPASRPGIAIANRPTTVQGFGVTVHAINHEATLRPTIKLSQPGSLNASTGGEASAEDVAAFPASSSAIDVAIYDDELGAFISSSSRRPRRRRREDIFNDRASFSLENYAGPAWMACGGFYWYVYYKMIATFGKLPRSTWIVQHFIRKRQWAPCKSTKLVDDPNNADYWEAFQIGDDGEPYQTTPRPTVEERPGRADRGTHACPGETCKKKLEFEFVRGTKMTYAAHGWDSWLLAGKPNTCGHWWMKGEIFHLFDLGPGWTVNTIPGTGGLPSRDTPPATVSGMSPIAKRFAACSWDCCCDPYLKGVAKWYLTDQNVGRRWTLDTTDKANPGVQGGKDGIDISKEH